MILTYVETSAEGVNEVSLETVSFARELSAAGGGVAAPADGLRRAPKAEQVASAMEAASTSSWPSSTRASRSPMKSTSLSSTAAVPA